MPKRKPCLRCGEPLVGSHPITLHPNGATSCPDGIDGRYCMVRGRTHHSADLVAVHRGQKLPVIMCGKHAGI